VRINCLALTIVLLLTLADELPACPVYRQVATKALRGDFGELTNWQRKGYSLLLEHGPAREGRAYVTHYTPWEGYPRGEATAYGWHCTEGCWAANAIPAYWYVLVQHPDTGFWELGWIRDNGASWNDAHWKRKAARQGVTVDCWLDKWTPRRSQTNRSWVGARYVAISAQKTW